MKPVTKLKIEILYWIAFPAVYWACLYLSPTYYPALSWECVFGYALIVVATNKVTNRWRKL